MLFNNCNKKVLTGFLFFISLFIISISCDTTEPQPPPDDKITKWEIIPELADMDVRYILKHNNTIYLTAVQGIEWRGIIWKTTDGENWSIVRKFNKAIGPLTTNGDTLYCLGDSLFRYIIPLDKWENICQPYPLNTDVQAVSEMIFLDYELYALQNRFTPGATYKIHFDGSIEDLSIYYNYFGGAKFIKKNINDDWCYVRGIYYSGGFFLFNRFTFTKLKDGLSHESWLYPPSNSMEIKNDTLFAGFRYPGTIKYLDNNSIWRDYTDSIPCNRDSVFLYRIEPTEITFINETMFISTDELGVMKWKNGEGWSDLSEGLKTYNVANVKLFYPIVFLENINENLIAAYGAPGYAAWGGVGVYRLKLN